MSLPPHRVDYSPIIERPPIRWPNGERVALWIAPNVEHYEYMPIQDGPRDPWPRTPYPDVQQYSYRDYGNRVGFWRMLEVLDQYKIRCCRRWRRRRCPDRDVTLRPWRRNSASSPRAGCD